jgi:hypothetical protein
MTAQETFALYVAAWNETDPEARRRLLERSLTADAPVIYPTAYCARRDDAVAAIGELQARFPGMRIVQTSGLDEHHGYLRATWRLLRGDGATQVDGVDYAELATDGRFARVIGFHDPLPPVTSDE